MCCSRPQLGVWRTVCPRATRGKRPRYLPIGYQNYEIVCRRPYRVECTGSLSTSEVKQHRARLVLGWGAAWEDLRVLSAFLPRTIWNCGATQPNCLRHPRLGAWHEMIGGAGRRVVGHGWRVGGGGSPRENPILKRPAANNQDSKCRTLHDQLQTSATRNAGN